MRIHRLLAIDHLNYLLKYTKSDPTLVWNLPHLHFEDGPKAKRVNVGRAEDIERQQRFWSFDFPSFE